MTKQSASSTKVPLLLILDIIWLRFALSKTSVTEAPCASAAYAGYGEVKTVVRVFPPGITARARCQSSAEREPLVR